MAVPARRLHAQEPDLIAFAQAYTAAWNAHDLAGVMALFALDAVVRERRGDVPPDVWNTHDPRVVPEYLLANYYNHNYDAAGLEWVTGHQQIASWAAARFAKGHRYALVGPPRTAEGTVNWSYQEFSDPYQRMPGVRPLEGTAEAVVHGGTITVLTLVLSPESVERQQSDVAAYAGQQIAAQRVPRPIPDGQSLPPRRPRVAEPAPVGWPLALGGLAVLASIAAVLRRRRAS